jgi:hypothetical protein
MCTECLTELVRPLARLQDHDWWYWTLRAGYGIWESGLIICGPQEEVAKFCFVFMDDGCEPRDAKPGDDPAKIIPCLKVVDPVEWALFFPAYAASLGKTREDYYDILEGLYEEAMSIFPRLHELMEQSHRMQSADDG